MSEEKTSDIWSSEETAPHILKLAQSKPQIDNKSEVSVSKRDSQLEDGEFAQLVALNRAAKEAISLLASSTEDRYDYHRNFLYRGYQAKQNEESHSFSFSLGNLPEFKSLGWRIGKGRESQKNLGVEFPLLGGADIDIASTHARFAWIKGGGGFFVIADNLRGKEVTLNGQILKHERRLVPFANTIGIGDYNFSIKFSPRSPVQEEAFQIQLSLYYKIVLSDERPIILATPSANDTTIGQWMVRNPISRGTFGHVSVVTHLETGKAAAMKEIWKTPANSKNVNKEINMAQRLRIITHRRLATPFEIIHETVFNAVERKRIESLLDKSWKPGRRDTVDKYLLFSPLATCTFVSLIHSKASRSTRTILFAQILEGIEFLHDQGIMHRDVKPANLAIESYDPPLARIIDFGCATSQERVMYDWPGTIPYLAPEQREGEYHDCSVDYWACGLVGIEILGFKLSSVQMDLESLKYVHSWIGNFADALALCSKQMLVEDPSKRLTAKSALKGPLKNVLEEDDKGSKRRVVEILYPRE